MPRLQATAPGIYVGYDDITTRIIGQHQLFCARHDVGLEDAYRRLAYSASASTVLDATRAAKAADNSTTCHYFGRCLPDHGRPASSGAQPYASAHVANSWARARDVMPASAATPATLQPTTSHTVSTERADTPLPAWAAEAADERRLAYRRRFPGETPAVPQPAATARAGTASAYCSLTGARGPSTPA